MRYRLGQILTWVLPLASCVMLIPLRLGRNHIADSPTPCRQPQTNRARSRPNNDTFRSMLRLGPTPYQRNKRANDAVGSRVLLHVRTRLAVKSGSGVTGRNAGGF